MERKIVCNVPTLPANLLLCYPSCRWTFAPLCSVFCSPLPPLSLVLSRSFVQFCAQFCSENTHNRWLQLCVPHVAGTRARGDYGCICSLQVYTNTPPGHARPGPRVCFCAKPVPQRLHSVHGGVWSSSSFLLSGKQREHRPDFRNWVGNALEQAFHHMDSVDTYIQTDMTYVHTCMHACMHTHTQTYGVRTCDVHTYVHTYVQT